VESFGPIAKSGVSLRKRLAYTAIIWLLTLAVAEIGLRIFWAPAPTTIGKGLKGLGLFIPDAELGWMMRPNFRGIDPRHGGSSLETNSQGFRDVEHSPNPTNQPRVVVLGDSFAFGDGVNVQDRFPDLLAQRFGLEVINLAVPRYDTRRELGLLRRFGLPYSPQLVLLAFCLNDVTFRDHDPVNPPVQTPPTPPGWLASLKAALMGRAQIYELLREVANSRLWLARSLAAVGLKAPPPGYQALDHSLRMALLDHPPQLQRDWDETRALLSEIQAICEQRGIRFVIAAIPARQTIEQDAFHASLASASYEPKEFDLAKPYRLLEEFCAKAGVACVNAYPAFVGKQDLYLPNDSHFNPKGHRLFAEAIAPALETALGK
jgi:lysophospholipase L1-like esterase